MGLAEDIRDYLTTAGFTGSIYIAQLPERPNTAAVITPTGGIGPFRTMSGTPGDAPLENERFQIRVRATDYPTADSLMASAHGKLSGMCDTEINGRRYYYVSPIQTPFYLELDELDRHVFACNYDAMRSEST